MNAREIGFYKDTDELVPASQSPTGRCYDTQPIGACPFCGWPGSLYLQEALVTGDTGHDVYAEVAAQVRCDRCGGSTGIVRKKTSGYTDTSRIAPTVLDAWNYRNLKC